MLNIKLPYDLAIPLLGTYPREMKKHKNIVHTKTYTRMFIAILFIAAKKWNNSNAHHLMGV